MINKLFCNPRQRLLAISWHLLLVCSCAVITLFAGAPRANAGDAPSWMHAQVNAPLPAHDEKTDAILLYSETNVTVISTDKIKTTVREVYKILRPNGRGHGTVAVYFNPSRKIKSLRGWCIPAQGKDYEIKDKDAVEVSPSISGAELISDTKFKVLHIPASDPGNIVGYEYEVEEQPFFLQDMWYFQETDPVRETHYSLQLPPGWEFRDFWLNHPEVKPTESGNNLWQWTVSDVKEIRHEPAMPPYRGIAGQMIVTFFPPGGKAANGFAAWNDMGKWYFNLVGERVDASPEIKQEVSKLTASATTPLRKMQAIAEFVQRDIRYVAIELGMGGLQPQPAP
jgi:hypothetical protein